MGNIYNVSGSTLYNDASQVASYYETELSTTVAAIRNAQSEPCLTFALVADVHYDSVDKIVFPNTVRNIVAASKQVRFDGIFCLGDMTDGDGTQSVTANRLHDIMPLMHRSGIPVYFTAGNHDCNGYGSAANYFTTSLMYKHYYSYGNNDVVYDANSYGVNFYKDFPQYKIRLISLDAANSDSGNTPHYKYPASTVAWFTGTALATVPAGYMVVLITHLSPIAAHNWNNTVPSNATNVNSAITSFVDNGGDLVCFMGHSHADFAFTSPYLEIATHCNKKAYTADHTAISDDSTKLPVGAKQWAQTYGTATEDCWDAVIIKPGSRAIDMVRFGAGEDRHFAF